MREIIRVVLNVRDITRLFSFSRRHDGKIKKKTAASDVDSVTYVDFYLTSPFHSLDRSYCVTTSALPDEECFAKISEVYERERGK